MSAHFSIQQVVSGAEYRGVDDPTLFHFADITIRVERSIDFEKDGKALLSALRKASELILEGKQE